MVDDIPPLVEHAFGSGLTPRRNPPGTSPLGPAAPRRSGIAPISAAARDPADLPAPSPPRSRHTTSSRGRATKQALSPTSSRPASQARQHSRSDQSGVDTYVLVAGLVASSVPGTGPFVRICPTSRVWRKLRILAGISSSLSDLRDQHLISSRAIRPGVVTLLEPVASARAAERETYAGRSGIS